MADTTLSYPKVSFRRFVAERLASSETPQPQALFEVVQVLADWRPDALLRYAGDPAHPIEPTEASLSAYLAEVERAWTQGLPKIFRLSDDAQTPQFALFFRVESTPIGDIESIWFSLPTMLTGATFTIERLMNVVATICRVFNAYHGCIEDERLLLLYRSERTAERARAALPPALRQFVPAPALPEGTARSLSPLLVPQEFDRRLVPDAVWWINFWDRLQVETVGLQRVRTAGWFRLTEQPSGALVLAATEEPTEVTNVAHMTCVQQILDYLGLYELQKTRLLRKHNL
ncbi:hypothetical protein MELA_00263 [Candidatus Methylomirabilis lanthanidiphila]|uniref:Uncharacterized protein n=1 Tax=Candidatus Methylomirabilis lanthanidiphila TaxID=2211376 RepID=A0A564ZF00_9BACT|nr:hypothetical protein [Candidatus Methylomirabilis lanthanidiphila]VUZ83905.1 hypothetical protein MELA_00263 [Candidatus Methylomirabilis lanthanidiphila]